MKTSVLCENITDKNFVFSNENITDFAGKFIEFVYNQYLPSDFPENCDYCVDITLCDNDFIHQINRDYRKIDRPTDVITFALFADAVDKIIVENSVSLGQILISIDKTISQAEENGHSTEEEFLFLLAHGVLHLFGFDHRTDEELEKMLLLQDKMIESLNYVKI